MPRTLFFSLALVAGCSSGPAVPECATGELLTAHGGALACTAGAMPAPDCRDAEVLTGIAGGGFMCVALGVVPDGGRLPDCTAGQLLASVGGVATCVTPAAPPDCATGEVLTAMAAGLVCVATISVPTCPSGQALSGATGGVLVCVPVDGLPTCTSGEVLTTTSDGSGFMCRAILVVPTCSAGSVLSTDGTGALTCIPIPPGVSTPSCAPGQVLTSDGAGGFLCVARDATIPTCTAAQVLTSDGAGGFTCVARDSATPTCTASQVLTSDGAGGLVCVARDAMIPSCAGGNVLSTDTSGALVCVDPATASMTIANALTTITALSSRLAAAETRVTALETRMTTAEQRLPGRYIGSTMAATNGRIVSGTLTGHAAADAVCNSQFAGSHFCLEDEIIRSFSETSATGISTIPRSWLDWAAANEPAGAPTTPNTGTADNCASWTYPTADTRQQGLSVETGAMTTGNPGLIFRHTGCFTPLPIACCR